MAYGSTHPAEIHHPDAGFHAFAWVISMLGVLAAAIGMWIVAAPDDGTISVFGRTWAASDLAAAWGPWLLIVGGAAAAIGMAVAVVRDWQHAANRWLVAGEALLAIVGVAAVVTGIVFLV